MPMLMTYSRLVNLIANVRMDIKDIMSQHNDYVDDILNVSELNG
jgi:hypothetical protein